MVATEHILLESDEREIPDAHAARKVHASLRLNSVLRRRIVALDIIDYYYLCVRTKGLRGGVFEYVLDLRFVEPTPRLVRRVAWRWLNATLGLGVLTAASIAWIANSPEPWWRHYWLPIAGCLFVATLIAGLVGAYRTTETLTLFSSHGNARVLEFVGGLGTFRAIHRFAVKLAAHVQIAFAARRPSRAQHLRDEMREHCRLKEASVISDEDYDESKRRILAQF